MVSYCIHAQADDSKYIANFSLFPTQVNVKYK